MEYRPLGRLGGISVLTLGGGGIGQIFGPTTREEAVATVRLAVEKGMTHLDMASAYGDGGVEYQKSRDGLTLLGRHCLLGGIAIFHPVEEGHAKHVGDGLPPVGAAVVAGRV